MKLIPRFLYISTLIASSIMYAQPKETDVKDVVVPRLKALSDSALSVQLLADNFGVMPESNDFSAKAQLYWNEKSVFISVVITDDSITGSDNAELFIAERRGGKNLVQFFVSGLNKDTVACTLWDFRGTREVVNFPVDYKLSSTHLANGTQLIFEIPLTVVGIRQPQGAAIGLQIVVADVDNETSKQRQSLSWSFANDTYRNSFAMVPATLGNVKSLDIVESTKANWDTDTSLVVNYISSVDAAISFVEQTTNKEIKFNSKREGGKVIYRLLGAGNIHDVYKKLVIKKDQKIVDVFEYVFIPKYTKNIKLKDMEEEIDGFKYFDNGKKIRPEVLFIGHSMFRYWATFEDDFKGLNVLNRGFGGSRLELLLYYYDRIIVPYQPKTIVLFNGINDINVGDSPQQAFSEFKTLVNKIHKDLPETRLFVLPHFSYKYANSPKLLEYDNLIVDYVNTSGWIKLIDVRNALPQDFNTLKACLYPDFTHLNAKGYEYLAPRILQMIKK